MNDKELAELLDDIEARDLERTPAARILVFEAFAEMRRERDLALHDIGIVCAKLVSVMQERDAALERERVLRGSHEPPV